MTDKESQSKYTPTRAASEPAGNAEAGPEDSGPEAATSKYTPTKTGIPSETTPADRDPA